MAYRYSSSSKDTTILLLASRANIVAASSGLTVTEKMWMSSALSSDTSALNSSVPPVVSSGKLTVAGRFDRDGYFCEPASKSQWLGSDYEILSFFKYPCVVVSIGARYFKLSMGRCILLQLMGVSVKDLSYIFLYFAALPRKTIF